MKKVEKEVKEEKEIDCDNDAKLPGDPKIILRDDHKVSRKNIDVDALKVIRRLQSFGYQAFLVGGGVRDLLLDKKPKDFDVSTSASPEDIRDLFRNSRIIGRRFKLVHVYFKGGKIIELSTFRATTDSEAPETLAHDNTYGDAESDALRRDLTINGLFYNPEDFTVIDYVGGMDDLAAKIVRIIGDPDVRFKEDPVRIIRAIRHSARIGFKIESNTKKSLVENAELLKLVPTSRLYEEVNKDLFSGTLTATFTSLFEHGLTKFIFPNLDEYLRALGKKGSKMFFERLEKLDNLVLSGKDPLNELFFCAFLIGHFVEEEIEPEKEETSANQAPIKYLCQSQSQLLKSMEDAGEDLSSQFKLPPVSQRRNNRDRISNTARQIGKWFDPVTLTKREKAAMERLLVLRFRLLTASEDNHESLSDIIDSIHVDEKNHLLWLMDVVKDELNPLQKRIISGKAKSGKRKGRDRRPPTNTFVVKEGNF